MKLASAQTCQDALLEKFPYTSYHCTMIRDLQLKLSPFLKKYSESGPLVIAGPCSAESETQLHRSAAVLSGQGVHLLRAGIWKPRTRPNAFEGFGEEALKWLKDAGVANNIPVTTEVANAMHAERALKAGIDVLWIGARTVVNPFSVQEIADALKGTGASVMVKNPLNPDIELWIGALERINAAGIVNLAAIHRGFSTYQDHVYRNSPNWEIPIELKVRCPDLPIICDPSHISGKRGLLKDVAQKALDLDFDGLMVEVHPDPDNALSDRLQQIALNDFPDFMASLKVRHDAFEQPAMQDKLHILRSLIDEIDHNLLQNLAHRMEIVGEIGEYKRAHGVTVFQLHRWREILEDRISSGNREGLDAEFVISIWNIIHQASISRQTKIVHGNLSEKD